MGTIPLGRRICCVLCCVIPLLLVGCGAVKTSEASSNPTAIVAARSATTAASIDTVATSATMTGTTPTPSLVASPTPIPSLETGEKVDVGDYALWIQCTGQGSPTVVMDTGNTLDATTWSNVQPGIAAFTRVCVYDRAGLGHSDRGPYPTSSQQNVQALHILLANAGVSGPYVPVGHSLGGLNMQLFARLYPSEVVGLVLIDAVNEKAYLDPTRGLPQHTSEGLDIQESGRQVASAPPMPDIPLIVLSRAQNAPDHPPPDWVELEQDLATRSPQGKLVIVEHSGHEIQNDQPDAVVSAIREVVAEARP